MFMIDICTDPEFAPIWNVVGIVINIIWIGVPILLIVLGSIDLGKAVIASDEKEVKAAQSRLIKRVIYAVLVFLVPQIVSLIMNVVAIGVGDEDTTSWASCWNNAYVVNK